MIIGSEVIRIGRERLIIRLAYSTEPLTERLVEFIGLLLLATPVALIVG